VQLEHVAHPGPPGQLAVLKLGSKALPRLAAITCRVQPGHAGPAATGVPGPPDVPDHGGLAGAAGPRDREDLAFLRSAGHVAQAHRAAVALVMFCTSVPAGTGRQVQRRNHRVPAALAARPCPGGRELIRGIGRLAPRIHRSAGPPPAGSSFARTPALRASQAASANSRAGAPCLSPRITPESGRGSYARAESPFACRTAGISRFLRER
jgi:hypothetical protein